jgi:DNA mismatch repair protein MutS
MLLITGPNMSGKSTYMRQLALIVLMAQAGCFVPADEAVIGLCDRIYTRIGASDNLSMGQSTFFVEMSELAYILNTATPRSLIILDEIGRGTSTYDGLSIAWAVVEHLTDPKLRARTLFATHYHELTALEGTVKGVKNLNVDVAEKDGNIIFLHKIVEGSASRSYGIHVAKLAGVPRSVLQTAEQKLDQLEEEYNDIKLTPSAGSKPDDEQQMSLFNVNDSVIVQKLKALDIMNITPSQAFKVLEELKEEAENS